MYFTDPYRTEDYVKNIPFIYSLSHEERQSIYDTADDIMHNHRSSKVTIPLVAELCKNLPQLISSLDNFLSEHPGTYFLRTSTCSPKDANHYLNRDEDEDSDDEHDLTSENIKKDLEVLKISTEHRSIAILNDIKLSEYVLQILCHSMRVFLELSYEEQSIVLLPWISNFYHDTETRCFVRERKLIACSQYYTDLTTGYQSSSVQLLTELLPGFIANLLNDDKIPYDDAAIDIALTTDGKLIMLEINPFNFGTDSCLLSWDEIHNLSGDQVIFVYQIDREIKRIIIP